MGLLGESKCFLGKVNGPLEEYLGDVIVCHKLYWNALSMSSVAPVLGSSPMMRQSSS